MQKRLERFRAHMLETFGARVVFVGIQGSVGRDKATPDSDRDVVVLLDAFTYEDLPRYREAIADLPQRERICSSFTMIRCRFMALWRSQMGKSCIFWINVGKPTLADRFKFMYEKTAVP